MSVIKNKLERDYLFGCIKYKNVLDIYLMPIAYWILNYKKYDPSYNPDEWEFVFRKNILNVSNENLHDFVDAVKVDKINIKEMMAVDDLPERLLKICFFVDLDNKIYINGFPDVEVEQYLPNDQWVGLFDNVNKYIPDQLLNYFDNKM